jgi:hypothetical protein
MTLASRRDLKEGLGTEEPGPIAVEALAGSLNTTVREQGG